MLKRFIRRLRVWNPRYIPNPFYSPSLAHLERFEGIADGLKDFWGAEAQRDALIIDWNEMHPAKNRQNLAEFFGQFGCKIEPKVVTPCAGLKLANLVLVCASCSHQSIHPIYENTAAVICPNYHIPYEVVVEWDEGEERP